MSITRRTFLLGAGSGLSLLVLTACVEPSPTPTYTPTPTPTGSVPPPRAMARSSWSTDSFARGSHSFVAVGSSPADRETLAEPILDRVFIAGEATSVDNAGTVLGARQSGARVSIDVAGVAEDGERIAVIGAGVAGAEAARLLTLRGFDVVVVEARDRVGGRIHSIERDDLPLTAEVGAWRLRETADADVLADLARLDIQTESIENNTLYRSLQGESTTNEIGTEAIGTAVAWAAEQSRDAPLSVALEESGAAEAASDSEVDGISGEALLAQEIAALEAKLGATVSELSSWFGTEATVEDADEPAVDTSRAITGNYSSFVENTLDGVETFLSTTVVGIAYDESGVSLQLGTGESLNVDRVILTAPLGVLKDDGIEFDPRLPFEHRNAIASLGFGTVDVVWLTFDEPFWSTDATVWNLVGTDHELSTWFNLEPSTGQPVLVGVVGGEAALRLAELDDDELSAAALAALEPFALD